MVNRPVGGEREGGASLLEALVVVAVLGVALAVTLPTLSEAQRTAALSGATARVQGLFFRARAFSVMNGFAHAVLFERGGDGSWRCFIATDGDGDGILRRDITRGVDPVVGEVLLFEADEAGLGILGGEPVPDPNGRGLLRGDPDDPVRAGRGDIVTFTPRSTATPCSVYLSDRRSRMRVIRVYGGTGRVIVKRWRSGWPSWRDGGP
jgi:type II secretory pathway pseudopilin PulG